MQFLDCIAKIKDSISLSTDDMSIILLSITIPFAIYFEEKLKSKINKGIIFISSHLNYEEFYKRENYFKWHNLSEEEQVRFFVKLEIKDDQPFLRPRSGEENELLRNRQKEIRKLSKVVKFLSIGKYVITVAVIVILLFN